jgi:hypothetical protein
MLVDRGRNPDRDDYGLPPVDVQIPDDARELDRDVQAYHREQRALRRRQRLRRFWSPLARHGLAMPVLAGCLALTLLAGTFLTLFSSGQAAWVPAAGPAGSGASSQTGHIGQPLPNANVVLDGVETPLNSLTAAVLAVVPPHCRCGGALRQLVARAAAVQANIILVGVHGAPVAGLTRQSGLRAARAAEDTGNVLVSGYHLTGLTAILVRPDGLVAAVIPARAGHFQLGRALQAVVTGTPQG